MATPIIPNHDSNSKTAPGKMDAPASGKDAGVSQTETSKESVKDASKDAAKPAVADPKSPTDTKRV